MMMKHTFDKIWQELPSAKKIINAGIEPIKNRKETKTPFYMFLHTLDLHERISFFSYDITDENIIKEEIDDATRILDNCGEDFKGCLIYQMSINYIDSCIKMLFENLKKLGLYENTTVLICADHGSSYSYYPIRENVVNNFHKENYNIPMLIWKKGLPKMDVNGMYQSKDIYTTLLDVLNIDIPKQFKGVSMLKNIGSEYVFTEYMGPGCPDMLTKNVWLSIRNEKYLISFKNAINKEFDKENIYEIYNLKSDSNELENIAKKMVMNEEIKKLIEIIEKRFYEIKEETEYYIKNLKNINL
jgi:phosphoglycerol transferase MdoB-like AlkP superfamily enzyme